MTCDDGDVCTADDCDAGNCSFTPFTVEVEVSPELDSIFIGDSISLTATSNSTNAVYTWSPPQGLSCTQCSTTFASPTLTTNYTVTASENGCIDTAVATIIVLSTDTVDPLECPTSLYVPNAFTPNGDGVNDLFHIYGTGIEEMTLRVFNRWGTLLFETTNPSVGWDGTYQGEPLNPDVYVYHLNITFCRNQKLSGLSPYKKGSVTLIR
jgi:gliding motility-associated-like protein